MTVFFVATGLLLAWSPAYAGAPTERLRDFFARVNAILADPTTADQPLERVVRVRRLVAEIADMPGAAAVALGPEWDARTLAERDEFTTLFAEVLERAYVGRLAGAVRAGGGLVMTYGDEVITADQATVRTAVRGLGGHDLRVEYRMTLRGGRWRVRDIVIDGVSTVENYRAQVARLLQQRGYVGVVRQLRAKLNEETLFFAKPERPAPAIAATPPAEQEVAPPDSAQAVASLPRPARVRRKAVAPVPPAPPRAEPVEMESPARVAALPVPRTSGAESVPRPSPVVAVAASNARSAAAPGTLAAAGPAPAYEPSALSIILGAMLLGALGALGATSATVVRRRAGRERKS